MAVLCNKHEDLERWAMADEDKIGTDWRDDELDAIVADYFVMLEADLHGQPYVKSKHNATLAGEIGRSRGSIEFKHQNISAVLDELGMAWIPGYKPRTNYQGAIFDAIERYLTKYPAVLEPVPAFTPDATLISDVFVEPPMPKTPGTVMPAGLRRLISKFDPLERDFRNRSLGKAGEAFVVDVERRRLLQYGRSDLAREVRWISVEEGDGAGYDVLSFDHGGRERLIEVKTTNGSATTPFFLTRNEREVSTERPIDWRIYRVHLFTKEPRIFTIAPPVEDALDLRPEAWRASIR